MEKNFKKQRMYIKAMYYAVAIIIILIGISCSKQDVEDETLNVKVVAEIGKASDSMSRYTGSEINNVAFKQGDEIGIFINNGELIKWTHTVKWTSEKSVLWNDRKSNHEFFAFYPYKAGSTYDNVLLPDISVQEGDIANLGKYDFLVTSKVQTYNDDGVVDFTGDYCFKHKCCLIKLNISASEDLKDAVITSIRIESDKIANNATYSFTGNSIELVEGVKDKNEISLSDNNIQMDKDKEFYIITLPKSYLNGIALCIDYTKDDIKRQVTYDNFADSKFTANKLQSYNVKIKRNEIVVSGAVIEDWDINGELEDIELE